MAKSAKRKTDDAVTTAAVRPSKLPHRSAHVGDSVIASRAYDLYLARDRGHGHDVDDWLQAEREFRWVDAQGNQAHVETTVRLDDKDYPIDGLANTTWAFTRIDDHTYDVVAKRDGKVTKTTRTVVSADGKTRTSTTTGTSGQGQTVKNVTVYEQ